MRGPAKLYVFCIHEVVLAEHADLDKHVPSDQHACAGDDLYRNRLQHSQRKGCGTPQRTGRPAAPECVGVQRLIQYRRKGLNTGSLDREVIVQKFAPQHTSAGAGPQSRDHDFQGRLYQLCIGIQKKNEFAACLGRGQVVRPREP